DGVALGWAHTGVKADTREIVGDELGGGAALVLVGRVGRDRLDLEELEQPLKARVKIGVDLVEDGGKRFREVGHVEILVLMRVGGRSGTRGPKHYMPARRTPRRAAASAPQSCGASPRWRCGRPVGPQANRVHISLIAACRRPRPRPPARARPR